MRPRPPLSDAIGFTLIELMVAVALLGIVGLGVAHGVSAQRALALRAYHSEVARQVLDYHAEAAMAGVEADAGVADALLELLPGGRVTREPTAGPATEIRVTWRRAGGGTASNRVLVLGAAQ